MPYGLLILLLPAYLRTAQSEPMPDIIISLAAGVEPGSLPRQGAPPPPLEVAFWWRLGVSVLLVLLGGIFAGLTLGLMGLDELRLRVLAESGEVEKDRVNATKVLALLRRGRHWVLVVLLLCNVIVNESLPIFLDSAIGGGVAAVVVSSIVIVIFGVIPQSVCVRYGLSIGAACAPGVLCLMWLLSPIAWPTAKLLDYILGDKKGHKYSKAELKCLLELHCEGDDALTDGEFAIFQGILNSKASVTP